MSETHQDHGSLFKRIWIPFFILFGITALEFLIAFKMGKGMTKNVIFIALTLLKAFYIMAFFMHLKFERINLVYSIVVPTFFIIVLLILLLFEASQLVPH